MPRPSITNWTGRLFQRQLRTALDWLETNGGGGDGGGVTALGNASITLAKPTRLVNRPATLPSVGAITTALPKANARPTSTIKVNALTQDDVTGAVLQAEVAPGLTLKQALLDARKAAKLAAALSA